MRRREPKAAAAPASREDIQRLCADAARLVYTIEELLGVAEEIERRAALAEYASRNPSASLTNKRRGKDG